MRKKISLIIFIWFSFLLFANFQYKFAGELNEILFWISVIVLIVNIVYQIFYLKLNSKIVLLEVIIFCFLLHMIYQTGYMGLRGSDSVVEYTFLKSIIHDHYFTLSSGINDDSGAWPILHLLSANMSILTSIDPFFIAKYFPAIISSIIILPLFLVSRLVYKNEQIALFTCLVFVTIPQFITLEALFIREVIAIFFMIIFFYIILNGKKRKDTRFYLLFLVMPVVIVLSHHFASFLFIILLLIYLICEKLAPNLDNKLSIIKWDRDYKRDTYNLFLLVCVIFFAYWVFQAVFVLQSFSDFFYNALGFKEIVTYSTAAGLNTPIITIRGILVYYGFFLFNFFFAGILIYKALFKKNYKLEDATFTIFFFLCNFYAFLATYVLTSQILPDRLITYAWLFGIIPIVGFILLIKNKKYQKIFEIILISFMLFNLYNIDPIILNNEIYKKGGVSTEKDYSMAETIKFPQSYLDDVEKIYGHGGAITAIQVIQQGNFSLGSTTSITSLGYKTLENRSYLINSNRSVIIYEDIFLSDLEIMKQKNNRYYQMVLELLSLKDLDHVNKIADLGNYYIVQGGGG